jgi:hypothetical protein
LRGHRQESGRLSLNGSQEKKIGPPSVFDYRVFHRGIQAARKKPPSINGFCRKLPTGSYGCTVALR